MKRPLSIIVLAALPALPFAVLAEVATEAPMPADTPARSITGEGWVSPGMDTSLDDAFRPICGTASSRGLSRSDPMDRGSSEEQDPVFRERRWPQIVKVIQWMRALAGNDVPVQARTLMPRLKAIFASEGVPPELAWMAEVESSLNPAAQSTSGARGLFQFMPVAAERFGLMTDQADHRGEPEKSARAAAQYLVVLYKRFGNWHLALAGYNAGEGSVDRLLREHHATTFDEIAPYLPEQTQTYVPKVRATVVLRENVWLGALPSPTITPTWN